MSTQVKFGSDIWAVYIAAYRSPKLTDILLTLYCGLVSLQQHLELPQL